MKKTCEFCDSLYEDSSKFCPFCGAKNKTYSSIKFSASGEPQTMEAFAQWYANQGLPPYETTRFFIGQNITEPKAFGIYREGENFVVYKNKANGERAIRYNGTDEAFAVREIYMRLKQEIVNQKNNNSKSFTDSFAKEETREKVLKSSKLFIKLNNKIVGYTASAAVLGVLVLIINFIKCTTSTTPDSKFPMLFSGLYTLFFIVFCIGVVASLVTGCLNLFFSSYSNKISTGNLISSIFATIFGTVGLSLISVGLIVVGALGFKLQGSILQKSANIVPDGYYSAYDSDENQDYLYYHWNDKWFYFYENDWKEHWAPSIYEGDERYNFEKYTEIPKECILGEDYDDYASDYGATDFKSSTVYADLAYYNNKSSRGYYEYDGTTYYHLKEYSNTSWYTYDDDSDDWIPVNDSDDIPAELKHPSLAYDFYYTPTWDSTTQFSDFADTEYYQDQIETERKQAEAAASSSSSSSDSSSSWSSSDSWDSGSTDWDSDW